MVVYGGEEVSALVVEIGSHSSKAGYAGEDMPKVMMRSVIATGLADDDPIIMGDTNICKPKQGYSIVSPFHQGKIERLDVYEKLLENIMTKQLCADPSEQPVLLVESLTYSKEDREKICEIAFEKFNIPAFFMSKDAVLTSFTAGRSCGLVVDVGHSSIRVTPVFDGYALNGGHTSQPTGGQFLSDQCLTFLQRERNVNVVPSYQVLRKRPVGLNQPSDYDPRIGPQATDSFHKFAIANTVDDFKECILQVSESPYKESVLSLRPNRFYEFPDGFNTSLTSERYRLAESLFNPKEYTLQAPFSTSPDQLLGIQELVLKSVNLSDVDIRAALLNNLVVTGGGSLLGGFSERLYAELASFLSLSKVKMHASASTLERKFGSWIGGSILASLGTFQQLWISKQDYEEHGASIVEKRCL